MHPFVRIFLYFVLLITLGFLPSNIFWIFFVLSFLLAFYLQATSLLMRCSRLKWLFLSVICIYAFTTPGEYIANLPLFDVGNWITKEGLYLGAWQVAKLVMALSLLSILFYQVKTEALMLGLYVLLSPLRLVKINPTQFVVRLMLTLNYVEKLSSDNHQKKMRFSDLHQWSSHTGLTQDLSQFQLVAPKITVVDIAILLAVIFYLFALYFSLFV